MSDLLYHFFFFLCAFLAVASALNLALNPNPVYGALGMAGGFFVLSVIYILINQGFFASIQLLVYAGAVMVLFLFIIMLLNLKKDLNKLTLNKYVIIGSLFSVILFTKLAVVISTIVQEHSLTENKLVEQMTEEGSLNFIGRLLFTEYLLPFEFISFLLLIAVVGAVLISKNKLSPGEN